MLDHWLWELTAIGPYPIPWILHGEDVIKAADPRIGTVYCWIHEPLVEVPMRAFLELGYPEAMVVADRGRIVDDGKYRVPGHARPVDGDSGGPICPGKSEEIPERRNVGRLPCG